MSRSPSRDRSASRASRTLAASAGGGAAFDPTQLPLVYHWWESEDLGAGASTITSWTDRAGNGNLVTGSGTVTVATASTPIGGKSARFASSAYLQATNKLNTSVATPTASSTLDGSRIVTQITDGVGGQWGWASAVAPSVGTPQWARLQYGTAFAAASCTIKLHNEATRGPKDFKIQGSNDGSAWTDLSTVTGETTWTAAGTKTFNYTNVTAYTYYRILVTATQGADIIYLDELTFGGVSNQAAAELWLVIKVDGDTGFPLSASNVSLDTRYPLSGSIYGDWGARTTRAIFTPFAALTSWRLFRAQFDGTTTVKYWIDNHLDYTHTSVSPGWLATMFMGRGSSGTAMTGNVAAGLIVPQMDDTQAANLYMYFNGKHGLTVT